MSKSYSTYEAKAKFSEIMRKVRGGQSVIISYRGTDMAEIKPIVQDEDEYATIRRLEDQGIVSLAPEPGARLEPLAKSPGALQRFLEERE
jgi:prevent-host-death family protein